MLDETKNIGLDKVSAGKIDFFQNFVFSESY